MTRLAPLLALLAGLAATTPACAGWFQVRNYAGTIGPYAVHVSVQTFDELQDKSKVAGSYWYDKHRAPIELHGYRIAPDRMMLCEGGPDSRHCPFDLTVDATGVHGRWKDANRELPVTLRPIGRLDNTGDDPVLEGDANIPMWFHTTRLAFVGHYDRDAQDGHLWLHDIRVIEMTTGRLVDDVKLDDPESGLLMTEIYSNVERGEAPGLLTLHIANGKMGEDVQQAYRAR